MNNLAILAATVSPSPDQGTLRPGLDPNQVSPGTLGFLATLFVVVLTILLILDMTRRVRRVRYREQVAAQNTAAQAADGGAPVAGPGETTARGDAEPAASAGPADRDDARPDARGTTGGQPGAGS